MIIFSIFIYLRFYVAFNTVQFISTTDSFVGNGNQYILLVMVLYCKLPTIGKQLPTFPHRVRGLNPNLRVGRQVCYHCATVAPYDSLWRRATELDQLGKEKYLHMAFVKNYI